MIWCDMIWYDMIWYDMIWYDDMIWYVAMGVFQYVLLHGIVVSWYVILLHGMVSLPWSINTEPHCELGDISRMI